MARNPQGVSGPTMRVRASASRWSTVAHPNATKLVEHLCAYLTGALNDEAGREVLEALKRARAQGHTALDSALLDIFRSYKPGAPTGEHPRESRTREERTQR